MELQTLIQLLQNFGAMGILAIMVWRLPQVISTINGVIQDNVKNVRETQREALDVFKGENDKILTLVGEKLEKVDESLIKAVESNTAVVKELQSLSERVGVLEHDRK